MFLCLSRSYSLAVFLVTIAYAGTAGSAQAAGASQARLLIRKVESTVSEAKSIDYQAVFTYGNLSDAGSANEPTVYTVSCKEQEPNFFRITIRNTSGIFAEAGSDGQQTTVYTTGSDRYVTFPLKSDQDWGRMHALLDKLSGSEDLANILDTTLIHKPMFDLLHEDHRDSVVEYSTARCLIKGQPATRVLEKCTSGGTPVEEAVAVSDTDKLLAYTVSVSVNGQSLGVRQLFNSLEFSSKRLPTSAFKYTPPTGATLFNNSD